VAARLLTPLGRWRRHDDGRQEKMKAQLQRILDHGALSKDSFEIARKSLG
jgi:aminopeptidase N